MSYSGNVLVTGGAGLIGSFISDKLVSMNLRVTVLDNFYRGKKEYLASADKVNFLEKNILDLTVEDKVDNVKCVIHTASKVLGIGYSTNNQLDMMQYNDEMTNSFLSYLDCLNELEQLIVVSSSCVYDDDISDCLDTDDLIGVPEKANLGYGLAKRFLEDKMKLYAEQRGLKLTIIRPFNIYGERYTWAGENSQGLPSLVKKLLDNNGSLEIWGTGSQRRNYIHAKDCANLILDIAAAQKNKLGIFNVGLNETVSLKELAEKMCFVFNLNAKFVYLENMPQGRFEKRSNEVNLRKLLPNFDNDMIGLEDGLLRMKDWYISNFKK